MQQKDYRVEIKVKNNNILKKIEEAGFNNVREFCHLNGKPNWQSEIGAFINLKKSPLNSRGELHSSIDWICAILYCNPEDLFTDYQMTTSLESNKRTLEMSEAAVQYMIQSQKETLSIEDEIDKSKLPKIINDSLETLTPREEKVINLRFGLNGNEQGTLQEIAKIFDVTIERIRQIESKALRKLRHPTRHENLREYIELGIG